MRMRGKVVKTAKSGLFFIVGDNKKTYICHKKFTESLIKEGRRVYFFPAEPRRIFDDETEPGKYPFAKDVKRFNELSDAEKAVFMSDRV